MTPSFCAPSGSPRWTWATSSLSTGATLASASAAACSDAFLSSSQAASKRTMGISVVRARGGRTAPCYSKTLRRDEDDLEARVAPAIRPRRIDQGRTVARDERHRPDGAARALLDRLGRRLG